MVRRAAERGALVLEVLSLRTRWRAGTASRPCLIGRSTQMERVRRARQDPGGAPADVLIYGETGTGKELVAAACTTTASGARGNFVPSTAAACRKPWSTARSSVMRPVPSPAPASGAIGKVEHASGGTLFLDEIESMPLAVQIKLLRALQERSIERLGSNTAIPIDCRVIAASKEDLRS